MQHVVRTPGVVLALLVVAALRPAAQTATLKGDLVKDWAAEKEMMVKIADAMPAEKFSYKSTPAQRSYAEQITHIAAVNMRFLKMLNAKTPAPAIDDKATSKADAIKAMTDSFDYGAAIINGQTDQSLLGTVQAGFMGPSTRTRVLYFLVGHTWDIYGQMAVYLRLNGIVPPASRRD